MKRLKILIIILLPISFVNGQVSYSISNYLRYGNGDRSFGNFKGNFKYFENLTDMKIFLPYNITIGGRLLYDNPPEVGLTYKGLKRRFIEYSGDELYIRAGNFSELYGRGLALNLFESRGLGFDSWMDGINLNYRKENFSFSAIAGVLEYKDSIEIKRNEDYKIYGGNFEIDPIDNFKIGLTYIYSEADFDLIPVDRKIKVNLPSLNLSINEDNFSFLFDYAYKSMSNFNDNNKSYGYGIYSSISYNTEGFGVTLDYKNYRFDLRDPFERNDITRTTRFLPFQNAPIVLKEHSYTLLTRAIHEVDFNDELGLQVEIFYTPSETTTINFNSSIASRHGNYLFDQNSFSFSRLEFINVLPSLSKKYSPYYELFGEVEQSLNEKTIVKVAAALRSKILSDEFFSGTNNHEISSIIFPFQLKHVFSDPYSAEFDYQYESVKDNFNAEQTEYSNHLFGLINVIDTKINVTFRYEFSTNRFDVSGKRYWSAIELGYRLNQNLSAAVSYGKEKGGQICSNGVCRYILPFEGLRISILGII
ncbi:MAG: DUF6029 family protein [Bacteroidota bacterium]